MSLLKDHLQMLSINAEMVLPSLIHGTMVEPINCESITSSADCVFPEIRRDSTTVVCAADEEQSPSFDRQETVRSGTALRRHEQGPVRQVRASGGLQVSTSGARNNPSVHTWDRNSRSILSNVSWRDIFTSRTKSFFLPHTTDSLQTEL